MIAELHVDPVVVISPLQAAQREVVVGLWAVIGSLPEQQSLQVDEGRPARDLDRRALHRAHEGAAEIGGFTQVLFAFFRVDAGWL